MSVAMVLVVTGRGLAMDRDTIRVTVPVTARRMVRVRRMVRARVMAVTVRDMVRDRATAITAPGMARVKATGRDTAAMDRDTSRCRPLATVSRPQITASSHPQPGMVRRVAMASPL